VITATIGYLQQRYGIGLGLRLGLAIGEPLLRQPWTCETALQQVIQMLCCQLYETAL